jgi:hypothetical protein
MDQQLIASTGVLACFTGTGDRLLRVSVVAARLQCSCRMVRYLAEQKLIPAMKQGTYFPDGKRASIRFWIGNSIVAIALVSLVSALKLPLSAIAKLMSLWK